MRSLGGTTNIQMILTSFHVAWSMFGVTIATASLMQAFRCQRSLILTW
jgi:hypothetical protein